MISQVVDESLDCVGDCWELVVRPKIADDDDMGLIDDDFIFGVGE